MRFQGSKGMAGQSLKGCINKAIRENKLSAIVNLGLFPAGVPHS